MKTTIFVILTLVSLFVATVVLADTPIERAKQLFETEDYAAARAILEEQVAHDDNNGEALCLLGRVSLQEEDYDGAIDRLKKAVKLSDDNSEYHTWLGRAYIAKLQTVSFFEKGMLAGRAQDHLKKAVKLDPSNVTARIFLANYYVNAPSIAGGSTKKALEQATEIAKYDELEGNALMANIHVRQKAYDKAIPLYEACIDADPENPTYRYRLGMAYQESEQYDAAFAAFEEVLTVDSDNTAALYQIGRTAVFSRSNLERAIECMHAYLSHEVKPGHPGYDAAHWRLGMLYEYEDEHDKAREHYQAALAIEPDSDNYQKALAALDQD